MFIEADMRVKLNKRVRMCASVARKFPVALLEVNVVHRLYLY